DRPAEKPAAIVEPVKAQEKRKQGAERRAQLAPLKKKIDACDARIESLRMALAGLDSLLADPAVFTRDPAKGAELSKRRADTLKSIEAGEEEWLELSEQYEAAKAE